MSKSIFNSDLFNSKNISNSNTLPDIDITNLTADNATITTITNTELQAATSGVSTNATNIATNTSAITLNQTNIASNATAITGLLAQQTTNTGNIATNASNIATNTSNISTNTSNIATNTSNIATNTSNIATNTSNIATNTSNISTNTSNISSLSSQQTTNTNNIATITHTVNGIAYEETPDRTTISNGVIIEKELDGNNPQQLLLVAPTNNTACILSLLGQESAVSGISNGRNSEIILGNNLSGSTKFIGSISTTLTDATNNLGDVVFNSINNITRTEFIRLVQTGQINLKKNTEIDGNLTLTSGKVLAIPNHSNVETALTTNASNIATNTSNIATNTSNIATNTSNIATNTTALTGITYASSGDLTTIDNHVSITRDLNHTPRMFRINFDKDQATNNLWGGDNVADTIKSSVQTGTAFHSGISNGLITISVAGFYRIKYQASVENDGQNGRITAGAFLKVNSTGYWKDDDHSFFASCYIRDDEEGDMASFQFEDYKDLAANDVLSFPTKLNLGTNTGFTDTTAEGNLDWFGGATLELIKTN